MRIGPVNELESRILEQWLPEFHPDITWDKEGFVQKLRRELQTLNPTIARGYLRAIDEVEGLVVGPSGSVHLPRGHFGHILFWQGRKAKDPRPIYFAKESLVAVAAVGDLVLDYGWPVDQVSFEPKEDWGLDVLVYEGPGERDRVLIGGEAKYRRRDLEKLITEVRACGRGREKARDACPRAGHKKYRSLRRSKPEYFWTLASGWRRTFRLKFWQNGEMRMPEVEDIPRYLGARR